MLAPASGLIEAAQDQLQVLIDSQASILEHQENELRGAFGEDKWKKKITFDEDFIAGYNLGLQTARVIIATSVQLQLKGVEPDSVL